MCVRASLVGGAAVWRRRTPLYSTRKPFRAGRIEKSFAAGKKLARVEEDWRSRLGSEVGTYSCWRWGGGEQEEGGVGSACRSATGIGSYGAYTRHLAYCGWSISDQISSAWLVCFIY